jgi:hypothetical protein
VIEAEENKNAQVLHSTTPIDIGKGKNKREEILRKVCYLRVQPETFSYRLVSLWGRTERVSTSGRKASRQP